MCSTSRPILTKHVFNLTGAGKTAILHRYVKNEFIEVHKSTIGADFVTKDINVDNRVLTLQVKEANNIHHNRFYSCFVYGIHIDMGHSRPGKISIVGQLILSRSRCMCDSVQCGQLRIF